MLIRPYSACIWPLLCIIVLLAGCRAERVAFQFQPARSTVQPNTAVLVPPKSHLVDTYSEEKPIVKGVVSGAGALAQKTKRPGRVRIAVREKARVGLRVYNAHRSQSIAQHKGYLAPVDSLYGLPWFIAKLGLPFLALCIVGIAIGITWLAITAGILAAFLFILALVLSSSR